MGLLKRIAFRLEPATVRESLGNSGGLGLNERGDVNVLSSSVAKRM